MHDAVLVAVITGCVALSNGILTAILNRKWKHSDGASEMRSDISQLYQMVDRLGRGLCLGPENARVIFQALGKHAINGESEEQEKKIEAYFHECTMNGFKDVHEKG